MAYIWGLLALVDPAFKTVTDSSDPAIRALMKLPASLADFGIARLMVYAFRARPALGGRRGARSSCFHPAVIDVSAWWGQYESIYLFFALAGVVLRAQRSQWAGRGVAVAVCVMTKPQALPFILPFAAWFWAHGGWRGGRPHRRRSGWRSSSCSGCRSSAQAGRSTTCTTWRPTRTRSSRSCRSTPGTSGGWSSSRPSSGFVSDQIVLIGPITFRYAGFALTGLLSLFVALLIARDPTPRTFILGLAASTLIWFTFLTQMHERYAYGALIFLILLIPERRIQWLCLAFGVVFILNLWSATPPAPIFREWLPYPGIQSAIGAVAIIAITCLSILWLGSRSERGADADAPDARQDHRVAAVSGPGGL